VSIASVVYPASVGVGGEGVVRFTFTPTPGVPILDVQVRLGTLVASEIGPGTSDLRMVAAQKFSVPRAPGVYNLTVWARNANGCTGVTTAPRPVTVQ